MAIDKIGNINKIIEPKKTKSVNGSKETHRNDSIQISSAGKKAADLAKVNQVVKDTPDIRAEKVADIKSRIENGTYDFNDNKILEMVADKIAGNLLR